MKSRIICIGNPFVEEDSAGSRVLAALHSIGLPAGVETIDGGLAGPGLLRFADGADRLVFVDAVSGFAKAGSVIELSPDDISKGCDETFGHSSGLGYLLRSLPLVCEGPIPDVSVIGLEGPFSAEAVERAARLSLERASQP